VYRVLEARMWAPHPDGVHRLLIETKVVYSEAAVTKFIYVARGGQRVATLRIPLDGAEKPREEVERAAIAFLRWLARGEAATWLDVLSRFMDMVSGLAPRHHVEISVRVRGHETRIRVIA